MMTETTLNLAVEISLYPLNLEYVSYIQDFIDRLNEDKQLFVKTCETSTIVSGEYDYVISVLQAEMKRTYAQVNQAIFVCKFLNANNINFTS